ncbi:hypothetical protein CC2G_003890 [Coprinopsis cinerea AmutBmut pab1-1]|nr:hypothetical protein CC2G_003890 [Coprinopsis cinerea AmutBmut pab1-1]
MRTKPTTNERGLQKLPWFSESQFSPQPPQQQPVMHWTSSTTAAPGPQYRLDNWPYPLASSFCTMDHFSDPVAPSTSHPPALQGSRNISLPPQTDERLKINRLLEGGPVPPIQWNINEPAMFAECPNYHPEGPYDDWRSSPAMMPSDVPSVDIRCSAFDKDLVVFPSESNAAYVTIMDVLHAVHCAQRKRTNLDGERMSSQWGNSRSARQDQSRTDQL